MALVAPFCWVHWTILSSRWSRSVLTVYRCWCLVLLFFHLVCVNSLTGLTYQLFAVVLVCKSNLRKTGKIGLIKIVRQNAIVRKTYGKELMHILFADLGRTQENFWKICGKFCELGLRVILLLYALFICLWYRVLCRCIVIDWLINSFICWFIRHFIFLFCCLLTWNTLVVYMCTYISVCVYVY